MNASQANLHSLKCEERQLLTQFLYITRGQTQIFADDDPEALAQSLELRQIIIHRVDDLLTTLIPLWQVYVASPHQDPVLADLHDEINGIIREVTDLDEKNLLLKRDQIDYLSGQLQRIREARCGADTYNMELNRRICG